MGWAFGTDGLGREIGYGVEAECDQFRCGAKIDRGLAYRCGELDCEDDEDTPGCGGYFCPDHILLGEHGQLCASCDRLAGEAEFRAWAAVAEAMIGG